MLKNKKRIATNKGITLIALVVTIVVLLILAGITISSVLSEGGIFSTAKRAQEIQNEAALREKVQIVLADAQLQNLINKGTLKESLEETNEIEVVVENGDGTITIVIDETEVTIDEETLEIIETGGSSETIAEYKTLKKYVLGTSETGRFLGDIMDMEGSMTFIDDNETTDVNEVDTLGVQLLSVGTNEDDTKVYFYVKSKEKAYRITLSMEYNTEKLSLVYIPKGNEGETTAEGWTILYDNGETVEAVSPTAIGELRLGYSETANTAETRLTEAIESYNTAIKTINDYCKNLENLPENSGVRSVGAAEEKTKKKYSSPNLKSWNSKYDNVGLIGDTYYEQDLVRMSYWGVAATGNEYWMASRRVGDDSGRVYFDVYAVDADGMYYSSDLWYVASYGDAYGCYGAYPVRPIITVDNL